MISAQRFPGNITAHPDDRGILGPCRLQHHLQRPRALRGHHHRYARLDYARLVGRNFLNCIAQNCHVVQTDGGNGAGLRGHHVGGIQFTPQANLYHLKVNTFLGENLEGHGRHKLEQGHCPQLRFVFKPGGHGDQLLHQRGKRFLAYGFTIQPDAFAKGMQVGRRVEPGLVPGGAQDGVNHGRSGTLALGAGYVDRAWDQMRSSQQVQEAGNPAQVVDTLLAGPRRHPPLVVNQGQ